MIFDNHIPGFPLSQFVERFVYYKGYQPNHTVDRFLPDGYTYVVFDFTDYPKFIYDNQTLKEIQSCRNVWFSGIREKYITIPSGRDHEMFIIYFRRGKAYPFVEMPMHELTETVVDGELVMSGEILNLREILLGCPGVRQKFTKAEQYLARVYAGKLTDNPFVDFAVSRILEDPCDMSIRKIAEKTGYSQKHLIKLFRDHVGVTPKAFMKIIRFQHAVSDIEKGRGKSWARLALDCGYYDQAHFIHDFREFSGFTPRQLLDAERAFTNYVAIG